MKNVCTLSKHVRSLPEGLLWFTVEELHKWATRAYRHAVQKSHPPKGEHFVEEGALWTHPREFAEWMQQRLSELIDDAFDRGVGQIGGLRFEARVLSEWMERVGPPQQDHEPVQGIAPPSAATEAQLLSTVADAYASGDGAHSAASVTDARHHFPRCDVPAEPAFLGALK